MDSDFNCTIQELKHGEAGAEVDLAAKFQLHHTGIKTAEREIRKAGTVYFNCTIQELKRSLNRNSKAALQHFNCTIQELKQQGVLL